MWNLLDLARRSKQGVNAQAAADLEAAIKEFADMFWATKTRRRAKDLDW